MRRLDGGPPTCPTVHGSFCRDRNGGPHEEIGRRLDVEHDVEAFGGPDIDDGGGAGTEDDAGFARDEAVPDFGGGGLRVEAEGVFGEIGEAVRGGHGDVGGRIGAEAVKVLLSVPRGTEAPIDARQRTWKIKRRVPSPEKVARARETIKAGKRPPDFTDWTFAKETLMLDYLISKEPSVEVEVQALQVGPAVFVSNPAEYFVQYGLDIKKGSKFPFTFPVELANGCVGYVPTEEAFGPKGGGYETRLTYYSNLEITAGRQFAETGIQLANELKPGPVPELPKLPAPGTPWRYGNVPPELN